ncbi:hypothetical protein [Streptomyces sp. NBC_01244]|uniref:hypothetical protein n=1 Tax=Streptomyces sp. NBC_01244 TaxID=2903797 RepID=UPI002E0DB8A8|nr:hypothetical protein OG247_23420 [Streptomyces sp. NBC_01244]
MTTPLPAEIPTVRVHGQYRGPDGRALAGTITFTAPGLLTFPASDLFIGGPVVATLDETGAFSVTLPATDAPQMNPSGWAWAVKENLAGIVGSRNFALLLPKAVPDVDLADVAPADPTTPNYVPVPGSQILSGSTVPAASLGANSDFYTQYDVRTLLGVTHTTVTVWKKSGGTWAKVGGDIRGSQWYVNTGTTPSTDAKPGDLLLRSDTGDFWQRTGSGWGSSIGNLKGPKGDVGTPGSKVYAFANGTEATGVGVPDDFAIRTDTGNLYLYVAGTGWTNKGSIKGPTGATGPAGPQGPKGDPGTGNVNTVNGKLGPDVVLVPADIGAVPAAGPATITLPAGSSALALAVKSADNATNSMEVRSTGSVRFQPGNVYIDKNLRVGGASAATGNGAGVLVVQDGTAPNASVTDGAIVYAEAGVLKVRQADGTVVTVGSVPAGTVTSVNTKSGPAVTLTAADVSALATTTRGAANGVASLDGSSKLPVANLPDLANPDRWLPSDLGLVAWAFDPATAISTPAFTGNGTLRFAAVVIRETVTVSKIAFHFGGYSEKLTAGSWAAIYTTAGVRRATTADMAGVAVVPGVHNAGGATVGAPLTASVSLTPGVYYVGFVFRYAASDGPMLLQLENGFGAPPNVFGLNAVKRFGVWAGGTVANTAPANIDTASIDNGANRFWAGLA